MQILLYQPGGDLEPWRAELASRLPHAQSRIWQPGDDAPADYALVWKPPAELLRNRTGLKAVFNLGAGTDALLGLLQEHPDLLPPHVLLIRLDDAGMAAQMVEYVSHAVLRHFRRFDEYADLQVQAFWRALPPRSRANHVIGVMGLGTLGAPVASALAGLGFPVRGWSNSIKQLPAVACYAGTAGMPSFLNGLHALVNMLPLTPDTEGILNRDLFARLAPGAHLVNVGRGAHLVEEDLLQALAGGMLGRATLDVFREEPLPREHPFWRAPRIDITPHVAALTEIEASVTQIVAKIDALEHGVTISGIVDRQRGY